MEIDVKDYNTILTSLMAYLMNCIQLECQADL